MRAAADIVAAIRRDLRQLSTATTPAVRAVRRKYTRALAEEHPSTVVAVTDALMRSRTWRERVVASELVVERRDVIRTVSGAAIERWSRGLADWGSVDLYGVTVAGLAWREGRVSDRQVMKWAGSTDRWRRRLALVSTVPLNSKARGGTGDAARTLLVCGSLVDDRDDMVVKALSWALRELAKRDPVSVARFMSDERDRLASRVLREVTSKRKTGRKA
jgi:3-methyladenine DNA glycosylase AlkD